MTTESVRSTSSRVAWKEGTFLRPHHFQQQDRHVEWLVEQRARPLRSYAWGFEELRYDGELLLQGKLRIVQCRGVFSDGTPFHIPDHDDEPQILEVPADAKNRLVYLTLPTRRGAGETFTDSDDPDLPVRYLTQEVELTDNNAGAGNSGRVLVGNRRLHLRMEGSDLGAFVSLPLLRIRDVTANKRVSIDDTYIAPCLDSHAVARLSGYVKEIQGLLQHRAEALAGRVVGGGSTAQIADLLLLQAVNEAEPLFAHLVEVEGLHPEDLFRVGLRTVGALSTYLSKVKRPARIPVYRHEDLQSCFEPLMDALRGYLSAVVDSKVIEIPLKDAGGGVRVGIPPDRELVDSATFVLAASADMSADALRRSLPANMKIGPPERIRKIIQLQVRGIPIEALPVAPRQLPFHQGYVYFELDKSAEVWSTLKGAGGIAIFAGAAYPGLKLELWAIKSN